MSIQDAPRQVIQGVHVLLLKNGPYIEVAERVRSVHKAGNVFSFERGDVLQIHQRWIYRASITVGGEHYIGDAEIYFDAQQEPDRTYPISCAQTSAVGNALAFAGFGDVRSILERAGQKVPETLEVKPVLASADAIIRAHQHAKTVGRQSEEYSPVLSQNEQAATESALKKNVPEMGITSQQLEHIHILCERLGESEPAYAAMTYEDAHLLITQLRSSEDELLLTADTAREQEPSQSTEPPQGATLMSREAVGMLKEAWLQAFRITGTKAMKRVTWAKFKREMCGVDVDDDAMLSFHHDQLLAAIVVEEERPTVPASVAQGARTPQANGQAH